MSSKLLVPVYDVGITLNEIPDKITFYIEMGNCFAHCEGCHSPHLCQHVEERMTLDHLCYLAEDAMNKGANAIVLMGGTTNGIGESSLREIINTLAEIAPVCLFSGSDDAQLHDRLIHNTQLTWLKTGSYQEGKGGLQSPTTNQRYYKKEYVYVVNKNSCVTTYTVMNDITERFYNEKTFRESVAKSD